MNKGGRFERRNGVLYIVYKEWYRDGNNKLQYKEKWEVYNDKDYDEWEESGR